jgi:hypothetical protein
LFPDNHLLLFSIRHQYTSVLQVATAQQQPSLGSSTPVIKGLLDDANQTLNSGNTTKTLQNLLTVQGLMAQIDDNSSSIQESNCLFVTL